MNYSEEILVKAYNNSQKNAAVILASKKCGCMMCNTVFPMQRIKKWQNKSGAEVASNTPSASAVCPICEATTVVGDAIGEKITPEFLEALMAFAMPMIAEGYEPIKVRTEAELTAELEEAALREAQEMEENEENEFVSQI